MTFYMTYSRSRPDDIVPHAEENGIGLMTNSEHRWSDATDRFLGLWDYGTSHVVDSGGYSVQRGWVTDRVRVYGEMTPDHAREAVESDPVAHSQELSSDVPFYPWSVEEYHSWLSENADKLEWAAAMDYACEEKFDPIWSVSDRMGATFDNTLRQFDMDPDYKLLPVLQGREIDQWVRFYDRLRDHGIPVKQVGLGTVCRLSSSKRIVEVEKEIRDRCSEIEEIHGFGVKIEAFKMGATFDTADSQAWVYAASNGMEYRDCGDRLEKIPEPDDSRKRTVNSFKEYYKYASRLKGEAAAEVSRCD